MCYKSKLDYIVFAVLLQNVRSRICYLFHTAYWKKEFPKELITDGPREDSITKDSKEDLITEHLWEDPFTKDPKVDPIIEDPKEEPITNKKIWLSGDGI